MINKKKLLKARKKIDLLDNKIFNLIRQRSNIVTLMLKLKQTRSEIVDKKRINQIIKNIKNKSIKSKIDSKVTVRIWKSIIWSYVDYQRRKFGKK